ncbi:hypothetical protein ScPMuIL_000798 [Solemya velum]
MLSVINTLVSNYRSQFGSPSFNLSAFIAFLTATFVSILDSVGDYYACARICKVPPPPAHAVNRGIAIEGLLSFFAGSTGIGHATTSYGPNLGALGLTRVASLRVFQVVGIMYVILGILGKVGAVFIIMPYPVLGGITIMSFGMFIGVTLSYLSYADISSTRNLTIVGISILLGLMLPYWMAQNLDKIQTGSAGFDQVITSFIGSPTFAGGLFALILDNTVPGSVEERGLVTWLADQSTAEELWSKDKGYAGKDIYDIPIINKYLRGKRMTKYFPFLPVYKGKAGSNVPNNGSLYHGTNASACDGEAGSQCDGSTGEDIIRVETDRSYRLHYRVSDNPPLHLTIMFAFQQVLLSISGPLGIAVLIAELVCVQDDDNFKTQMICTTMMMSAICTLIQVTVGVRLPVFQGPTGIYFIPLFAMTSLDEWRCPSHEEIGKVCNIATYGADIQALDAHLKLPWLSFQLSGPLILAGVIHALIGLTGLVGILIRYVGPITVLPSILLLGLNTYPVIIGFCETHWGATALAFMTSIVLSLYLGKQSMPIPIWTRRRGFHVIRYPAHQVFSVLIAILVGWGFCFILTEAGVLSDDPESVEFFARTDSRTNVISETDWFYFPHPGQFGGISFHTGVFIQFLVATVASILDSIGDYYACAKMCHVPPPPAHSVNRGIAIEGIASAFAGVLGACHATTTYGGNIGAIGITRYIDTTSTRNISILGISLLVGLMMPHWVGKNRGAIQTGVPSLDSVLEMLIGSSNFAGGVLACFLDNTVPGTLKERGIEAWQAEVKIEESDVMYEEGCQLYSMPLLDRLGAWKIARFIPFLPAYDTKSYSLLFRRCHKSYKTRRQL